MSDILLLGPGKSRSSIMGRNFDGENITVIERDERFRADWTNATYLSGDLRYPATIRMSESSFDEVHAYEVLNLLPGTEKDFFEFWVWVWMLLRPAGQVFASTPNWKSRWIYAYPGQQRVYTPELLDYLDQGTTYNAKESFSNLWPSPFCFKPVFMVESTDGNAFYFRLAKC
jgi:hypothetical protein